MRLCNRFSSVLQRTLVLCSMALAWIACDEASPSLDSGVDASPDSAPADSGADTTTPPTCPPGDAPFVIDATSIEGRTLTVTVSYSGGCEEHDFVAWWSGALGTSSPPQAPLDLVHYGHGDSCEAYLTEDVLIDLSVFDAEPYDEVYLDILPNAVSGDSVRVLYTKPSNATPPASRAIPIDMSCGTTGA